MLIRSQDNKKLVNFDSYEGISINYPNESDFQIMAVKELVDSNLGLVEMGTYYSEEKAIKVLDMIESAYKNECRVFQMPADEEIED